MVEEAEKICVGAIVGAYGVRGEVRLKSFCSSPEAIDQYGPLHTEDGQAFDVKITRRINNAFAARLSGITNKEQADQLKGTQLFAPRAAFPSLGDDEFYHADLIGLEALTVGGESIGKVQAVHDHGAGDIVEIRGLSGKSQLIPFTKSNVPTIDLSAGRMIIDPPEERQ